ncbi:MAG: hypothetical protein ACK55I_02905, partial [bacterium]
WQRLHGDVVDGDLGILGVAEEARAASQVARGVGGLDGPDVGLRLPARPDLAPQDGGCPARAGLELERVPAARLPRERNRLREVRGHLRRPGAKLQLLGRAHEVERVALGDEPHVGHPGLLERRRRAEGLREGVGVGGGR